MSQIIRATLSPVVPAHGNTRKVARSGRRYMSDSSMRTKPSIDDPSNMILPSSASSNCRSGISTFLMMPDVGELQPQELHLLALDALEDLRPGFAGVRVLWSAGRLGHPSN